ncbi:TonB-dependent receptor [Pedobacter sp. N36a]|uniref:TonB-dependent receptor n=1 Tax=Pedobacter sp. N36a TaxID=2767996 RepID=UPI0016570E8F|nr:TonB-dependent receptor [Pedobacter sp. N36a]MBC8988181.1 TonB-dependent receptor [Pedobacter sp. N36a]
MYGYDERTGQGTNQFNNLMYYPIRPSGSLRIPTGFSALGELADRYLSYFGNVAYTYLDRYTFSGSWRWDGSNLFGVKTNQKGVPLWSVGQSWQIGKEPFYTVDWLPNVRLRTTYGSSGNVNKQITSFPVTSFVENINGLPAGIIISAGNPGLRWEKVNTFNVGLDFATKGSRIQGSIDYYTKKASDLIGKNYLAPSTGIIEDVTPAINNLINYANMQTKGFDLQLTSQNLVGKFNWETTLLLSYTKNKITNYSSREAAGLSDYFADPAPPRIGTSRDVIYWLPWAGLDHNKGAPLVNQNGNFTINYQQYIENFNPAELLQGLSVPPLFGSIRNTLSYKNMQVSATVSFKTGYVFRKRSMYSGEEYLEVPNYNMDYFKRWKQPGDELATNVPAASTFDIYQGQVYGSSAAVIAKGDHVRMQDVTISYAFNGNLLKKLNIQNFRLYGYARDLGIIWQADKSGIDPDYPNAAYPTPASYAIGIQASF